MRLDERVDPIEMVDARRVFEVGAVGILMALAEAHQRLVGPGIVVKHRDLDDPGRDDRFGLSGRRIQPLQLSEHVVGLDHIGIELHLIGRVGRADLGDTLDPGVAHRIGDEEALEKSLERHGFIYFGEDVLIAAEGKSGLHGCWPPVADGADYFAVTGAGTVGTASAASAAARPAVCDASHGSSQAV